MLKLYTALSHFLSFSSSYYLSAILLFLPLAFSDEQRSLMLPFARSMTGSNKPKSTGLWNRSSERLQSDRKDIHLSVGLIGLVLMLTFASIKALGRSRNGIFSSAAKIANFWIFLFGLWLCNIPFEPLLFHLCSPSATFSITASVVLTEAIPGAAVSWTQLLL